MGRKHVLSLNLFRSSDTVLPMDMTIDLASRVVDTSETDKASIHLKWSAGPVGEFHVMVRNNEKDAYYELNFGSALTIDGTDSEMQLVLTEMPFVNLQLTYTATSGSGTLAAFFIEKSQGA